MNPTIPETAVLFKALGDETRLKILKIILNRGNWLCTGAIARQIEISPPAVSQQLKLLKSCKLVDSEKSGYNVHYSVRTEALDEYGIDLKNLINRFGAEWDMGNCPINKKRNNAKCLGEE